ncbi:MAG: tetratricopeptide repeat protein [Tannerellaceae bacterium]|jgi:tetratricopeptide (TPR) repeat protein|nr:tetratricopeptide repeat protein [Tannerellaceae bacterium]
MKKSTRFSRWLERFLEALPTGNFPYYDTDEICAILDNLEFQHNYTHYEDILNVGLHQHPGNSLLLVKQCHLYTYKENYELAIKALDCIPPIDGPEAEIIRVECYCELDRPDEIVKHIKNLYDNKFPYVEDLLEFAAPLMNDMNMSQAVAEILQWAVPAFPDNDLIIDELGFAYEACGDYEKAIRISNQLIDQNPYSTDHWYNLGRLYSFNGNYSEAIEAFEFAIACAKEGDDDKELIVLLAYCFFMNENYEKAIEIYNKALNIPDKAINTQIKSMIAECYAKLEDFEHAFQTLQGIIDTNTSDSHACLNYVRCSMETDRKQEASRILRRTAGLLPANIRPLTDMAIALLEKGKTHQAIHITDEIMRFIDEEDWTDHYADEITTFLSKNARAWGYDFYQRPVPTDQLLPVFLSAPQNKN